MARDEAYRNAEQKIEEARLSGATELNLSLMKLVELPESLGQLTSLQSLNLSGNELTTLPEWLGQLTQLQSLSLSGNQLTALPEWMSELTQLKLLNLSDNQLATLPEWLGRLTQLESLGIAGNQLATLPEWLGQLTQLESLDVNNNRLTTLPEWLGQLAQLQDLDLAGNQLTVLPESVGHLLELRKLVLTANQLDEVPTSLRKLKKLERLYLYDNKVRALPDWIGQMHSLTDLSIGGNQLHDLPGSLADLRLLKRIFLGLGFRSDGGNPLGNLPGVLRQIKGLVLLRANNCELKVLPDWLSELSGLSDLFVENNQLTDLPASLGRLKNLSTLDLDQNPLNAELSAAYGEGLDAVRRYLRAKAEAQVVLNEAKLILVGEGEVGKSCLLDALRGDPWKKHVSTHGIEIKPVKANHPDTGTEITLNGWDFGGQRVYRPTHQLFFSAPAVYLVVWKPREGPQQGFVKDWIKLIKHREPDAKILVVATHGGPGQRQPDLDRQEIWDLFGKDTVIEFFHVESKPDRRSGKRRGIDELKQAIARVAATLPEMGRSVPARWQQAREALTKTKKAYLPLAEVLKICRQHKIRKDDAGLFVKIQSTLGHLIHYEHDAALQDIVILKPDWLATAISFVFDDKQTRDGHGLVSFSRLSRLWNDPKRKKEFRYPPNLHPVFLRLMERFDLSYVVAGLADKGHSNGTSLIAQLVPDIRPDPAPAWPVEAAEGDEQQVQICRIVDTQRGQSASAEGLFYRLIVRLHKYSLGRVNYMQSVHWQRGLVLDDDYNGRALLEHIGNDVHITVRAPYPEAFLSVLTREVKWLVEEDIWAGLRCEVVVPCVEPCGKNEPGHGAFEVQKLIAFKRQGMTIFPCLVSGCNQAQDIDHLLRNAPAARRTSVEQLLAQGFGQMRSRLDGVREQLNQQEQDAGERFRVLDLNDRRIMSQVEDAFTGLLHALTDEAKDGPRLFSFQPVDPGFFDRPKWINQKFQLTLWCEHSRLPLPSLNGEDDKRGVYDLNLPREWFVKAAPFFKVLTSTLSLVLPVASSATKLLLDDATYKGIEKELDLGQKSIESVIKGGEKLGSWLGESDAPDLERGEGVRAQGAILRQLHSFLKEKDPGFGGLVRVRNKRQEFLWVHPQFEKEY